MKNFLKKFLPRGLVNALNSLRPSHRRWLRQQAESDIQVNRLKSAHDLHNAGAAPDEIVLHGQQLRLHAASRLAFEYFSYRSPEMVREMELFLHETKECHRLLDVGALHGIFSLLFVNGGTHRTALAIDASPVAFERLMHNVSTNDLSGKIMTCELALSDGEGKLAMHYDWEHAVASSASDAASETISVVMTSGDRLCATQNFEPDVIKIDVEGHEPKVLRGLMEIIARHRPLIFLEVHPQLIAESRDDGRDVLARLEEAGYGAVTIQSKQVPLSSLFSHDERFLLSPRSAL